jgi:hypothetical protein
MRRCENRRSGAISTKTIHEVEQQAFLTVQIFEKVREADNAFLAYALQVALCGTDFSV